MTLDTKNMSILTAAGNYPGYSSGKKKANEASPDSLPFPTPEQEAKARFTLVIQKSVESAIQAIIANRGSEVEKGQLKISPRIYTIFDKRSMQLISLGTLPWQLKKPEEADQYLYVNFYIESPKNLIIISENYQQLPHSFKVVLRVLKELFQKSFVPIKAAVGSICNCDHVKEIPGLDHLQVPFTKKERVAVIRSNGDFQIAYIKLPKSALPGGEQLKLKIVFGSSCKEILATEFRNAIARRYLVELDEQKLQEISQKEIEAELAKHSLSQV